jgi:prepilin-type N-terminal cleavage/methylation domain-containing protein
MKRYLRSRRQNSDGGFTLIELLITTVILGVITIPLANLVISYFTTSTVTTGRLSESHDEQIAAAYFAQDVASVGTRSSVSPYNSAQSIWTGSFPAGSCGLAGGGTPLILLKWDDKAWNTTTQTESVTADSAGYFIRAVSGQNQLHRVYCTGAAPPSDVVLAHNVNAVGPNLATCSSMCSAATLPATVTLQLEIKDPAGKGQPYTLTLNGQRRQAP